MTNRLLLLVTMLGILICMATWSSALHITGDRIDCRSGVETHFCALRTRFGSGFSIQWGERERTTVWAWHNDDNWRIWPPERASDSQ
jgi:hypothetical protein